MTVVRARGRVGELQRALDLLGFGVCAAIGLFLGAGFVMNPGTRPVDADRYWQAGHAAHYYGTSWGATADSFYAYPPPLAQVLGLIPWLPFVVVWMPLTFIGVWLATRWWSTPIVVTGVVAILLIGFDNPFANAFAITGIGNAQSLVAAAIVLGFRWPAAWAFVILTKIGPGIGILWFAARGEWRNLAVAVGATGALAGMSIVLGSGAWADFGQFATTNANAASPIPVIPIPLPIRVAMSALLIVWGARTNRRWTVPIAAGWSALALYESSQLSIWMAALPLMGPVPAGLKAWLTRTIGPLRNRPPAR